MDIKERILNTVDWVLLKQDRKGWWGVAKTMMILCAQYDLSRFLTS
jgi:hypothetical protein